MHRRNPFIVLLVMVGITNSAMAQPQAVISRWDRDSAMAAVASVDIDSAINDIGDLEALKTIELRNDWPLPAREAALYKYTQSLAALRRDAVAIDVMRYLGSYQAQVLVPHEDHGDAAIPLFNIRGAAAGVENGWIRAESSAQAQQLLVREPTALVARYLQSANPAQRSGFRDALAVASDTEVQAVQAMAMSQLGKSPELTGLLAVTAVLTADSDAIHLLLTQGSGSGLATAFGALASASDPSATAALLEFAIEQAPAANAALAIAAWWPGLRHDAASRQLLLNKLSDPALGSAVALALAGQPDIQTIRELQLIAAGESLAARRAQLALNINHDVLLLEVHK